MTLSSRCVSISRIRGLQNRGLTHTPRGRCLRVCFIKRFEPRTDVTRHRKPDVRPLHDGAVNPYSEWNKLAWEATSSLVGAIDNDNHPQPRKTINRKERNGKWDTSLSGFVTSVNCSSLRESSFKWCNYEENKSQVTKGTRIVCFMVLCWMSY